MSGAAAALCIWVHAIYIYANVAKEIAPKRQRLKDATDSLAVKQEGLREAQEALAVVTAKLAALQVSYDTSVGEKNDLREESEMLEAKVRYTHNTHYIHYIHYIHCIHVYPMYPIHLSSIERTSW